MLINVIIIIYFILSIYFTIKYKFIQLKSPIKAFKVMKKDKNKSAYRTFMVSLASHIGTGNVVGITSALIIGGKGSLFWMWVNALFMSIFSLIENTLGQVYKVKIDDEYRGGSAYYISKGLNKKWLGIIISIFLVLANTIFFQPLQVNTISESIYLTTGISKYLIFICLSLFAIFVIFKGTKSIIKFSEIIVPIMSLSYITIGIIIVIFNIRIFPNMIGEIIEDAFSYESILGGVIFVGMKKSLFSHEAGLGTMPTISAMSNTEKPSDQGFISCFGVFIDTIIICSITGFMILLYDINLDSYTGVDLIIYIFEIIFGTFGKYLAVFFMISFALATVVSQFYLGESNLLFITKDKVSRFLYKCLFLLGILLGVFLNNDSIWTMIDTGLVLLGAVNIYSVFKLQRSIDIDT